MKVNQFGRSMVEMLGVLGIIGVITVGGYSMIGKSLDMQRNSRIIADTAHLAAEAKKLSCQYASDSVNVLNGSLNFDTYTDYLHQSEAYPSHFEYKASKSSFIGVDDVEYFVGYVPNNGNIGQVLTIKVSRLNEDQCVRMATTNWGTPQSSGFMNIFIGDTKVGTHDNPVSMNQAAAKCAKGNSNVVKLEYKGCR